MRLRATPTCRRARRPPPLLSAPWPARRGPAPRAALVAPAALPPAADAQARAADWAVPATDTSILSIRSSSLLPPPARMPARLHPPGLPSFLSGCTATSHLRRGGRARAGRLHLGLGGPGPAQVGDQRGRRARGGVGLWRRLWRAGARRAVLHQRPCVPQPRAAPGLPRVQGSDGARAGGAACAVALGQWARGA